MLRKETDTEKRFPTTAPTTSQEFQHQADSDSSPGSSRSRGRHLFKPVSSLRGLYFPEKKKRRVWSHRCSSPPPPVPPGSPAVAVRGGGRAVSGTQLLLSQTTDGQSPAAAPRCLESQASALVWGVQLLWPGGHAVSRMRGGGCPGRRKRRARAPLLGPAATRCKAVAFRTVSRRSSFDSASMVFTM